MGGGGGLSLSRTGRRLGRIVKKKKLLPTDQPFGILQARGKPGRGVGLLPAQAGVHGKGGHHGAHPLSGTAVHAEGRRGSDEHAPRAGDVT